MKKPIINEDLLRLYVRNEIRKNYKFHKINEINVSQSVGLSGINDYKVEMCKINIPQELKVFINEVKQGRKERIKIILYLRALKHGVKLDNDFIKKAAEKKGIMRGGIRTIDYVDSEIPGGRAFRNTMDAFGGGLPGGGVGFRAGDFPIFQSMYDFAFDGLSMTAGNAGFSAAADRIEAWQNSGKQHVDILVDDPNNPGQKMTISKKVPADLSWQNFEEKFNEQFENIVNMMEGLIKLVEMVANYSGMPSIFCKIVEKSLKYFGKIASYFYEPQDSRAIQDMARELDDNQNSSTSQAFNIDKEITKKSQITHLHKNTINNKIKPTGSIHKSNIPLITYVLPEFTDALIAGKPESDLIASIDKDKTQSEKIIDDLELLQPTALISKNMYDNCIRIIKAENLYSSRNTIIDATDPDLIKEITIESYCKIFSKILDVINNCPVHDPTINNNIKLKIKDTKEAIYLKAGMP